MRIPLLITVLIFSFAARGQFAPPAGMEGSTAIAADSSIFIAWAEECEIYRSWMNISDTTAGKVSYGNPENALGQADNLPVSLGDGGYAVAFFETPVVNGTGYDFAVFENAFSDDFLELAFVEVSSDGEHYYRFPSVSLTPVDIQTGPFGTTDATKIHNFAGKYRAMYGTPFDLEELAGNPELDIMNIHYIKIIDVIGSIDEAFATYDSQGNIVNDPFPTPFPSGGFDLDAIGIIHSAGSGTGQGTLFSSFKVFPNPVQDLLSVTGIPASAETIKIFTVTGKEILTLPTRNTSSLQIPAGVWEQGVYFIKLYGEQILTKKLIKL